MPKRALGASTLDDAIDTALTPTPRKKKSTKKKPGRPPTGLGGSRMSDYARVTLWLPDEAKARLERLSRFTGRPMWHCVVDAIEALEATLSPAERKGLRTMRTK